MSGKVFDQLLEAGAHFGHLKRKWNPAMAPYIFGEKNGIHIIDLNKTVVKLDEATHALRQIARSGKKILFVATKKQAKDIVADKAKKANMPYVTERWPGGMLTNFATIRKSVKKMAGIDKMAVDGTFENISKKEILQISRQRAKLEMQFGSVADLTRLPAALFVVDILHEHIAVSEARKLNIPTFAIVDTNSDPTKIDFSIPANDDAASSINVIIGQVMAAVEEGLNERKVDKEAQAAAEEKEKDDRNSREEAEKLAEESVKIKGLVPPEDGEVAVAKRTRRPLKRPIQGGGPPKRRED